MRLLTPTYCADSSITYASPGGQALGATLFFPRAAEPPWPAVVLIHGGGFFMGSRYQQFWYCRNLAKAGFAVMTIKYRLMPKHPFPACVEDAKSAVRWLRLHADRLQIDAGRIASFGASAGGHIAAFLATAQPQDGLEGEENPGASSHVSAAISLYGMLDLAAYAAWETHPARRWVIARSVRAFAGDSEGSRPDLLRYASPVAYVRPETPPVMLVHGAGDWLVPHQASRSFKAAMDAAGAHCEYIEKDGRNHGFDYVRVGERRRLFKRMLAFYREHLLLKETV